MSTKYIRCKICNNSSAYFYHKIGKYNYFFCNDCYSLFLYPKPSSKSLRQFYAKNFDYTNGEIEEKNIRRRSKDILKTFKSLNPQGKNLLDIGSGLGYFIDEANKLKIKTTGIEPSKKLFQYSKNKLQLNVINTILEKYLSTHTKKYDFIALIHVIEHIENPFNTVRSLIRLLNKNGVLLIETPNLDSHLFRAEEKKYSYMSAPEHLWVFSKKSLRTMILDKMTFSRTLITTYSTPENFMGIIKKLLSNNSKGGQNNDRITINKSNNSTSKIDTFKIIKIAVFDKFLARFFISLINLNDKGSIIRIYIQK